MKSWKRILMSVLLMLTRLRMPQKNENEANPAQHQRKKPIALLEMAADKQVVAEQAAGHSAKRSADGNAVVIFGPHSWKPLLRSQLLRLLRSDCQASPRRIDWLVLHCSDTKPSQNFTVKSLINCHKQRQFGDYPGYHLYVRRDGTLYYTRPISMKGCHVKDYNSFSIGLCYEGGHSDSPEYKYEDNRTAEQLVVIDEVFRLLHEMYPKARIVGHNELNPMKKCPCLDGPASREYGYIYKRDLPPSPFLTGRGVITSQIIKKRTGNEKELKENLMFFCSYV